MCVPMPIDFPHPATTQTIDDVITVGGELTVENLINAYLLGIFPWPHKGYPLLWFCPEQRGIIDFKDLHLSRSLEKWIKKNEQMIEVRINHDFSTVIKSCRQQKRADQKGSWINAAIEKSYTELSQLGGALSLECYIDNVLVSGIYGVKSKNYFSCESMFFKIDNGSKFAFIKLIEYLQSLGHNWMDLQMITEVSGAFGGKYISKFEFLQKIK
ncbi:MAG: leucyl/phenylalanyl-tRNA--protein transferase [Bdellovibrionaceae bacterium]|nr:leucyl/phenylalanyl-tRNA--protein transferase [Pseudobdellovibrionaceae bacterium]